METIMAPVRQRRENGVSEFLPITSVAEFSALDEAEVLLGYLDGVEGVAAPGSGHSRSFAHGWHNGMVDSGRLQPCAADRTRAEAFARLSEHRAF